MPKPSTRYLVVGTYFTKSTGKPKTIRESFSQKDGAVMRLEDFEGYRNDLTIVESCPMCGAFGTHVADDGLERCDGCFRVACRRSTP